MEKLDSQCLVEICLRLSMYVQIHPNVEATGTDRAIGKYTQDAIAERMETDTGLKPRFQKAMK